MKRVITLCVCLLAFAACQSDTEKAVYPSEDGVSEAEQQMLAVLEKQAEHGSQEAQFQLVFHRDWMKGHYDKALPAFEKMAQQGSADAAEILSMAYREGKGVAKDNAQAVHWLERAATLGSESARRNLEQYAEFLKAQETQNNTPSE